MFRQGADADAGAAKQGAGRCQGGYVGKEQARCVGLRRIVHVAEGEGHIDHVIVGNHVIVAANGVPLRRIRVRKRRDLAQLTDGPDDLIGSKESLTVFLWIGQRQEQAHRVSRDQRQPEPFSVLAQGAPKLEHFIERARRRTVAGHQIRPIGGRLAGGVDRQRPLVAVLRVGPPGGADGIPLEAA